MSTHICTHMTNINISLTEDAYNYLKMLKGKDKSFSDVVMDIKSNCENKKGSKESIMKFFGGLKDKNINWDEKEKIMKEFRKDFNNRVNSTIKEMRKNDRI